MSSYDYSEMYLPPTRRMSTVEAPDYGYTYPDPSTLPPTQPMSKVKARPPARGTARDVPQLGDAFAPDSNLSSTWGEGWSSPGTAVSSTWSSLRSFPDLYSDPGRDATTFATPATNNSLDSLSYSDNGTSDNLAYQNDNTNNNNDNNNPPKRTWGQFFTGALPSTTSLDGYNQPPPASSQLPETTVLDGYNQAPAASSSYFSSWSGPITQATLPDPVAAAPPENIFLPPRFVYGDGSVHTTPEPLPPPPSTYIHYSSYPS
jgi:hypothetical protein